MGLAELHRELEAADGEIQEYVKQASDEEVGIEKLAAEYDAAGRIMARGFYDEFLTLASGNQGE